MNCGLTDILRIRAQLRQVLPHAIDLPNAAKSSINPVLQLKVIILRRTMGVYCAGL